MVHAVAEGTVYQVLLVHRDDRVIDGFHVYRGGQLLNRDRSSPSRRDSAATLSRRSGVVALVSLA
jgi:hypothetical protein